MVYEMKNADHVDQLNNDSKVSDSNTYISGKLFETRRSSLYFMWFDRLGEINPENHCYW